MRSLFLKIFLWFGAAQVLIGIALALFTAATQRSYDEQLQNEVSASLEERARAAAVTYEVGGLGALRQAWRFSSGPGDGPPPLPNLAGDLGPSPDGPSGADTANDGPAGNEPAGNGPPRGGRFFGGPRGSGGFGGGFGGRGGRESGSLYVLRASKETSEGVIKEKVTPVLLVGPPSPPAIATLLMGAKPGAEAITYRLNETTFLSRGVQTVRGNRYVAVISLRFPGRRTGFFEGFLQFGPGPGGPLRLLIVALTMGAVCFALARYLTDPAIKLSRATRQFASGDLAVRVAPLMGQRRDELADLGRDFDLMAERIQTLLLAERRLLGDISHELRSPLTRLRLALDLATQTADSETRPYLERIEGEAEELNALIGQLLTLTRLESAGSGQNSSAAQKYTLDVGEIVAHVCDNANFEARARGGGVEVTQNCECEMEGNGELLHSALENVVRNAIIHSRQNPRVEVSLTVENLKEALICVRDHGPGVPPDALPLLFRPFYRVAEARDRQSGGTGLGLSITQRAVQFHGGTVEAFNAPGGGLLVKIRLPLQGVLLEHG